MTVARLAARVAVHVPESMRHLYTCHIATFTIALLDKDRTGREKKCGINETGPLAALVITRLLCVRFLFGKHLHGAHVCSYSLSIHGVPLPCLFLRLSSPQLSHNDPS